MTDNSEFQKKVYESQEDYYNKYKDVDMPRISRIQEFLKHSTKTKKSLKIIDIGCAGGEIIKPFAKDNELFGVDISEAFLKTASKNGLKVKKANLEDKIPFNKESFDIALCSEVIEHIIGTDKLLSEINRILKMNSELIITIPNVNSPISYPMMLFLDYPPYLSARYRGVHVRDFTLKTITIALENNGFKVSRAQGTSFYAPSFGDFFKSLAKFMPRFSRVIVISATKVKSVEYNSSSDYTFDLYSKNN